MIQKRGARYRVVVYAGRNPFTGKRRQLSGSASTKLEARQLEIDLERKAALEAGSAPEMTLAEVVQEWWGSLPRLAATTTLNYRHNLQAHILPALGDKPVSAIRPRLAAQFLHHVSDKGLAPGSVRKVRTVLSAIMAYAVAMEWVDDNPVMKVPPPEVDAVERRAPTLEETARILAVAEEHDPDFLDFLWVAAEEGGRRGETLGLRWGDVDLEARTVTIRGVVSVGPDGVKARPRTKTKRVRTIALSSVTVARLAARRERIAALLSEVAGSPPEPADDDFVFSGGVGSRRNPLDGLPWRPDSTTRRFRAMKELAGVDPAIDLHSLRHSMITELLMAGVDPRTVMGRAGQSRVQRLDPVVRKSCASARRIPGPCIGSPGRDQIPAMRGFGVAPAL